VSPGNEASLTLGSFTAFQTGDTAASYSARIDWGDGTASYATLSPSTSGGFTVTGAASYAVNGDYAVRVLITQLSSGQSIALNSTASVDGFANSGGGLGGGSTGSGQNPAGPFFVARLNQAVKPKYYDVITLQNESGQTLVSRDVGRVMINNKSYKLHVTKWSSGAEAVIVLNSRQAAGPLFSFDFFGKKTSGLQSLAQSKETKRFNPQLGYAFQIIPSGSVIAE
jgi:flagellar capping protein FliD